MTDSLKSELVKYVPAWFPGARLQKEALYGRKLSADMRNAPFDMVKTRLVGNRCRQLIVSFTPDRLLARLSQSQ